MKPSHSDSMNGCKNTVNYRNLILIMRLLMMGTGPFAVPTFHALLNSQHTVTGLVTRPPVSSRSRKAIHNPMLEASSLGEPTPQKYFHARLIQHALPRSSTGRQVFPIRPSPVLLQELVRHPTPQADPSGGSGGGHNAS